MQLNFNSVSFSLYPSALLFTISPFYLCGLKAANLYKYLFSLLSTLIFPLDDATGLEQWIFSLCSVRNRNWAPMTPQRAPYQVRSWRWQQLKITHLGPSSCSLLDIYCEPSAYVFLSTSALDRNPTNE